MQKRLPVFEASVKSATMQTNVSAFETTIDRGEEDIVSLTVDVVEEANDEESEDDTDGWLWSGATDPSLNTESDDSKLY